jgi:dinuclear metal center YbgI/SA1388 family protein
MLSLAALIEFLDAFAPPSLAAEWDNVGLLLGDRSASVQRVMTCLTVTPESAAEAVAEGAQLIVTHHPILFHGVKSLTDATAEGRTLLSLIRARVAVYSPHTSFDNTKGGINDALAGRLQLHQVLPLRPSPAARQCKVVVFVPDADLAKVSDAMFAAGAGNIGQYRQCSFRLAGTGTFFGSENTNPAIGKQGRREEVSEWRQEAVCPESCLDAVIAAMRRVHSYEEPAYDIYALQPSHSSGGEGRIGNLAKAIHLRELAQFAKDQLGSERIQIVGDPDRFVQRVAMACGAAGEFLKDALRASADVFLTGEMRFHDYLSAQAQAIALILPGHYATERFAVEELAARLKSGWPDLHVWASKRESDPVRWV